MRRIAVLFAALAVLLVGCSVNAHICQLCGREETYYDTDVWDFGHILLCESCKEAFLVACDNCGEYVAFMDFTANVSEKNYCVPCASLNLPSCCCCGEYSGLAELSSGDHICGMCIGDICEYENSLLMDEFEQLLYGQ